MTLQDFDSELSATLVKRGKEYFRDGLIAELEQKRNGIWTAMAYGSDEYSVEIHLKNEQVTETACTCPYDGPVCKHAIGTLFAIRSETTGEELKPKKTDPQKQKSLSKKLTTEDKLEMIRHKAPMPVLVDILLAEATENKELRNRLFAQFAEFWGESPLKVVLKSIKSATGIKGSYGFADYYATQKMATNLYRFIQEAAQAWSSGNAEFALGTVLGVLEHTIPVFDHADDSTGSLGDIVSEALEQLKVWTSTLPTTDLHRKTALAKLQLLVEKNIGDGFDFHDDLLDLLCALTSTTEEKVWLLSYTQSRLPTQKEATQTLQYREKTYIRQHVSALLVCGKENEAREIKLKYRIPIYEFLVELHREAIEARDMPLAKLYIEEGLANTEMPGYVQEWRKKRTNWYLLNDDRPNYMKTLFETVIHEQVTVGFIKSLQTKMTPGEWKDFRNTWLEWCRNYKPKNNYDHANVDMYLELLLEGGDLDLLWKNLGTLPFDYFEEYHSHFLKTHPAEVINRFYEYALDYLDKQYKRDRSTYQVLAGYLRKIKKLGGTSEAKQAKALILQKFPKSPALKEELGNV